MRKNPSQGGNKDTLLRLISKPLPLAGVSFWKRDRRFVDLSNEEHGHDEQGIGQLLTSNCDLSRSCFSDGPGAAAPRCLLGANISHCLFSRGLSSCLKNRPTSLNWKTSRHFVGRYLSEFFSTITLNLWTLFWTIGITLLCSKTASELITIRSNSLHRGSHRG